MYTMPAAAALSYASQAVATPSILVESILTICYSDGWIVIGVANLRIFIEFICSIEVDYSRLVKVEELVKTLTFVTRK